MAAATHLQQKKKRLKKKKLIWEAVWICLEEKVMVATTKLERKISLFFFVHINRVISNDVESNAGNEIPVLSLRTLFNPVRISMVLMNFMESYRQIKNAKTTVPPVYFYRCLIYFHRLSLAVGFSVLAHLQFFPYRIAGFRL